MKEFDLGDGVILRIGKEFVEIITPTTAVILTIEQYRRLVVSGVKYIGKGDQTKSQTVTWQEDSWTI